MSEDGIGAADENFARGVIFGVVVVVVTAAQNRTPPAETKDRTWLREEEEGGMRMVRCDVVATQPSPTAPTLPHADWDYVDCTDDSHS
jgi:hypothetical protein